MERGHGSTLTELCTRIVWADRRIHARLKPALETLSSELEGLSLTLVDIATRRQGLMVRPGNPKEIFTLADLTRPQVRFINRQPGSGTRLLLEGLLQSQGIAPTRIAGFGQGE